METGQTPPVTSDMSNDPKPQDPNEKRTIGLDTSIENGKVNRGSDTQNDDNDTYGTHPLQVEDPTPTTDDPKMGKLDLQNAKVENESDLSVQTATKAHSRPEGISQKPMMKIVLVLLLLILIAIIAALAYWFGTSRDLNDLNSPDQDRVEDIASEDTDAEEDEDIVDGEDVEVIDDVVEDLLPAKLFYSKDYDVYSYDFDTGAEQLLVDNSEDVMNVGRIDVIDIGTIGFGSCETVTDDFGCALYTYDLESGSLNTVRELGPDEFMMEYDFFDPDTYVYVSETTVLTVYYVDGVSVEVADEVTDGEVYGRGGFEDDDQTMRFNNDGTRFYDISTSSLRSSMDFTIYVYDTSDLSRIMIENSTHPEWIGTDTLIYKSGEGLTTVDLETNETTVVTPVGQSAYEPYALQGDEKVLYTVDMGNTSPELWVLDLSDGSSRKVADDAVRGIWVSQDLFVYESTEACTECMSPYMTTGVMLGSDPAESVPEIETLYNASSYYSY